MSLLSKDKVAPLVTKLVEGRKRIRESEEELRNIRREAIKAGRFDLARQSLETPSELQDLAELLWYDRPIVITEETLMPSRPSKRSQVKPAPIDVKFQKKFVMQRSDGQPFPKARADTLLRCLAALRPLIATKIKSDVLDRCYVARRGGKIISQQQLVRELAIETAPLLYPLEEWATIFPDAALVKDYDFINRIIARFTETPQVLDLQYGGIAFSWPGFEWLGLANRVPPLKHWSDKAACEFVAWWIGNKEFTINAYKARKKKLGLRSEKPKLVTFAEYTRLDKKHLLHCER